MAARISWLKSARFFSLRGALKGKAYANKPRIIQELENNIRRGIAAFSEDVLQATFANMKRRVQLLGLVPKESPHVYELIPKAS